MLFHDGVDGVDDAERTAWTVGGVPVAQIFVLADGSHQGCPGTAIAYHGLSTAEATALVRS